MLLSFAYSSGSRAQSASQKDPASQGDPQKAPAITFKFSGDTHGKSGGMEVECVCSIQASLTQIPSCGEPLTHHGGKGEVLLDDSDPCCCADLEVSFGCPGQLCGFNITFDNNNFDPLCSVCLTPPGWTVTQNPDGSLSIDFSGTNCSGALGNQPLDFQFCGFNTPGPVGYTVEGFYCTSDLSHDCIPGTEYCSQHFESTINCGTGSDAANTTFVPFSVDAGFPNPASSSIRFDYSTPLAGMLSCTLVDILGKTVSTSSNTVSTGSGNIIIGLNGAQPGAYYCVFDLNGQRVTKRIEVK
jgi:hypothetical protein